MGIKAELDLSGVVLHKESMSSIMSKWTHGCSGLLLCKLSRGIETLLAALQTNVICVVIGKRASTFNMQI